MFQEVWFLTSEPGSWPAASGAGPSWGPTAHGSCPHPATVLRWVTSYPFCWQLWKLVKFCEVYNNLTKRNVKERAHRSDTQKPPCRITAAEVRHPGENLGDASLGDNPVGLQMPFFQQEGWPSFSHPNLFRSSGAIIFSFHLQLSPFWTTVTFFSFVLKIYRS